MLAYDVIAFDPDIARIVRWSIGQDDGERPTIRIRYLGLEEREVPIDDTLSADYHGLALHNQLATLPELGEVTFARFESIDGRRHGWNFVAHAELDARAYHAWRQSR